MRVLSLDASSTTIGCAVIDFVGGKIKLKHQSYYKPLKKVSIFEMLSDIQTFVTTQLETWKPDDFVIEDIVQYMAKRSGAKTIILLAILNRTICLHYYNTTNKEPVLLNVMKIRHTLKKTPVFPKKEEMPELVAEHLGIEFPYEYNRNGKIKTESYDVADAIAVGLAHIKIQSSPKPVKKSKKKKKKK